jgi:hypothetical protein
MLLQSIAVGPARSTLVASAPSERLEDEPMPPLKSRAIVRSKRTAAPDVRSPHADTWENPAMTVALSRPVRRTPAAPSHMYRVGDRLRMNGGGQSLQRVSSTCRVLSLLPYEGHGALLYRVRSEAESFERIVSEADIAR